MNVFKKVTLQSLKKNKTRTIVTIIGIVLSAAMICAVTTFTSSIRNFAMENAIYQTGSWHGMHNDTDFSLYHTLLQTEETDKIGYMEHLGYAPLPDSANEFKPYLYVLGASEQAGELLPIHITSGRYPQSPEEILLPEHLANNGGVLHALGDTMTLPLGNRMLDGFVLHQMNPCYYQNEDGETVRAEEVLETRETRTYKVVGFYERPEFENYTAPGYTCITLADPTASEDLEYDFYYTLQDPRDIFLFLDRYDPYGTDNYNVLRYCGIVRYDSFSTTLNSVATIVIALIMFGSVSLIYNAFSISVSERTKQFGLLSSVGATKKQLRRMVIFEALAVSLIGIPLGILSGIGGIGVTLMLIGNKFRSLGFPIDMEMNVSPVSIVIAIAVSLVTVLISAWIPSRRATKVTAVEAIRQNSDIKIRPRQVKTPKFVLKLFGLPGMLAEKYYKRSKKKYRATIVSLFMSIVLFISAASFTDYLASSVNQGYQHEDFEIFLSLSDENLQGMTWDELMTELRSTPFVTDAVYVKSIPNQIQVDSANQSQSLLEKDSVFDRLVTYLDDGGVQMYANICFLSDEEFLTLAEKTGLDSALFFDREAPRAITIDKTILFNPQTERFQEMTYLAQGENTLYLTNMKQLEGYRYHGMEQDETGASIAVYGENTPPYEKTQTFPYADMVVKQEIHSAATVYDHPFYFPRQEHLSVVYPISMLPFVPLEQQPDSYDVFITSSDHAASYKAIEELLDSHKIQSNSPTDIAEIREGNKNTILIVQVFSTGFIVLISLIAAANVFNTISTNIGLRRREFAMLKSVGMTGGAFNRMMNYECLLYGTKALLLGLPVSIYVSFLIFRSLSGSFALTYHLPLKAMVFATCSVFVVVFITMLYAMGKIKKDNPIDALKNENL